VTFPLAKINGRWSPCICLHEGTLTRAAECGKFGALRVAYNIGCTLTQKIGNEGAAVCKRVDNRLLHNTKNTSITVGGVNSKKRTVIIMMCKKKKYIYLGIPEIITVYRTDNNENNIYNRYIEFLEITYIESRSKLTYTFNFEVSLISIFNLYDNLWCYFILLLKVKITMLVFFLNI